jgi:alpha-acetolactate decarboxylase
LLSLEEGDIMVKVKRSIEDYKDIINLPRHVSKKRGQMPISNRAAQFAPFAAVVGHDAAIEETSRYTAQKKELDEMEKGIIDENLRQIYSWLPQKREIKIVYFEKDKSKAGGCYVERIGCVKKIDSYNGEVIFFDGQKIDIEDIYSIDI